MTSLKTSIKTITYLSDTGCLEIQGASLASSKQSANSFTIECFEAIIIFSFWPWYKQTIVVIGKCQITKFSISNQMPGEYILITDSDGFCIQIVLRKQVIDC